MTEATHEGAEEFNTPSPTSVDSAAQKLNGIFGEETEDTHEETNEEEREETQEEESSEVLEGSEEEPETEDKDDSESEEEDDEQDEPQPLTSLQELAKRLDVDESSLYDIKLPTKVDGEEGEATLAQLIKSYQLEGHLNRKSMELSDSKKELEKQQAQLEQERHQKLQEIQQAAQLAQKLIYGDWQSVNWEELKQKDPEKYLLKKAEFQEYQQSLGYLNQMTQAERQKAYQDAKQQFDEVVKTEQNKLLEAIPEWNNKDALKKEYSELVDFMKSDLGVTDEELSRMVDHRYYLMARDAKRYRDLQKRSPKDKKDRKPVKTAKAGNRGDQKQAVESNNLRKQFSKRKDVNSAAALINAMAKK